MSIQSINRLALPELDRKIEKPAAAPSTDFGSVLSGALSDAHAQEAKANEAAASFVKGEGGIHEVMIAQEKASIAVRYAVTMKNKALEAYREILNTQI